MKLLITMFAILLCLIIITGCGPHFNRFAKPDYDPDYGKQQEQKDKQEQPPAPVE